MQDDEIEWEIMQTNEGLINLRANGLWVGGISERGDIRSDMNHWHREAHITRAQYDRKCREIRGQDKKDISDYYHAITEG